MDEFKIKPGDWVRRIIHDHAGVTAGKVYQVSYVGTVSIRLVGRDISYSKSNFKLYKKGNLNELYKIL